MKQIEAYVDDPEFWYYVIGMDEKLHLHAKPWLKNTFLTTANRQLLRLSGVRMSAKMRKFAADRVQQCAAVCDSTDAFNQNQNNDYILYNQQRLMDFC